MYLNRQYLLKALGFGLRRIGVQEPLKPLRFSDGGSRQMIVMPVRVDANPPTPKPAALVPAPVSPVTPAAASTDAAPDQPTTLNPNPQPPTEGNNTSMQNGTSNQANGNGHQPAVVHESASPEEKPSLEQALDQIESLKASLRAAVGSLNNLIDIVRQAQRERRVSEREGAGTVTGFFERDGPLRGEKTVLPCRGDGPRVFRTRRALYRFNEGTGEFAGLAGYRRAFFQRDTLYQLDASQLA